MHTLTTIKRNKLIFCGSVLILIVVLINQLKQQDERCECHQMSRVTSSSSMLTNVPLLQTNERFSIFFIESNMGRDVFDLKQTCAIESAARHNPDADVFVYTLRARLDSFAESVVLVRYPNLKVIRFRPEQFFRNENDARINAFWNSGHMMNSRFAHAHLSDFLRYYFF